MALKLNGSSSGYVAIDAPAAAGSNTLTLPADNGSANEFLQTNGSGTLDWAGGGKTAQIVQKTSDVGYALSNTGAWTAVHSDLDLAITTTNNSSKVLITADFQVFQDNNDWTAGFTFYRDSTNLGMDTYGFRCIYGLYPEPTSAGEDILHSVSIKYLDTPGAAGTYTYKIYYKSDRSDCLWNQTAGSGGRNARQVIQLTELLP